MRYAILGAVMIGITTTGSSVVATKAADVPNLAGTWLLVSQTRPTLAATLTITSDGKSLKVADGRGHWIFNLDGTDAENPTYSVRGELIQRTARATWISSALLVTITTSGPSGTWGDIYTYSLDGNGQLTVVNLTPAKSVNPVMITTVATYKRG